MSRRARQLALRQHLLLLRSAELRRDFIEQTAPWQTPLALADRVQQGWRWLRGHPEAVAAGAVTLAVLRPRRAWRWGARMWWAWRLWKRVQRLQVRYPWATRAFQTPRAAPAGPSPRAAPFRVQRPP